MKILRMHVPERGTWKIVFVGSPHSEQFNFNFFSGDAVVCASLSQRDSINGQHALRREREKRINFTYICVMMLPVSRIGMNSKRSQFSLSKLQLNVLFSIVNVEVDFEALVVERDGKLTG